MKRGVVCAIALLASSLGAAVCCAEAPVAWSLEFDDPADIKGASVTFRPDPYEQDVPGVVQATVEDGLLHMTCDFEKDARPGVGAIGYGKGWIWDTSKDRPFEPVELAKYPMAVVRYRSAGGSASGFVLHWRIQTPDGQQHNRWLGMRAPAEFVTERIPLANVATVQQETRLMGLAFVTSSNGKKSNIEIDTIRIEALSAAEMAQLMPRKKLLDSYTLPPVPKWAEEQFVFGCWDTGMWHWWPGHEGLFGAMTRAHTNLICREETDLGSSHPEQVLPAARRAAKAADVFGIKVMRRYWYAGRRLDLGISFNGIKNYVKPMVEGLKDVPNFVGWNNIDEPGFADVWQTVGAKRIFEELDPDRVVVFPVNNAGFAKLYKPYTTIFISDRYPIKQDKRDPWEVGPYVRSISLTSDRPHWFIPQTFGTHPSKPKTTGDYALPTAEEWRLMVYLAVANGAKGILPWAGTTRQWTAMWDAAGNECAMMPTIKEVGMRLVTVGPVLMKTRIDVDSKISATSPTADKDGGRGLSAGVLYDRGRDLRYLVVVNESLTKQQGGRIVTGDQTAGRQLYDLYALEPVRDLQIATLAPGDGRIYLLGDDEAFAADRERILSNRRTETLRVMKPDLRIARRWEMDLALVDGLIEKGESEEARKALEETMAKHEEYAACKAALAATAADFAKIADSIYDRYFYKFKEGKESGDQLIRVAQPKLTCLRERLIRGWRENLLEDIQAFHLWMTHRIPH